ncbi:MAG TPA: WecB/TagA/CpsF family glycosyltransferase [Pelobium sp.]|nr:WecB/TagA/CpsF family glycosyltransferase [Pelobium sp.]
MANSNNIHSIGYDIFAKSLDQLPTAHQTLVNTINQYSYCVAENDAEFKTSLQNADVLLPDGIAIVAAVKLVDGIQIKKIAGADLHQYSLEKLNQTGGSCFYLGSSPTTLQKIKDRVNKEYPNVKVGTFSPPYKSVFTDEENTEMLTQVNNFKPDVLFIGMTAPKQEKWAYTHKNQLAAQLICSIGAVFDFYAGTVERPNKIWINFGLEWLGRLVKEPKRMWKRYIYYGPVFFYHIINQKFKNNAHTKN